jgi:hypothetical protein
MVAYYQEVRKLEDKFDSLVLNNIPRRFNEVADELAKMASDREPISIGIFASNQHKPLVHYEEPGQGGDKPPASCSGDGQLSAPFDPSGLGLGLGPVAHYSP